VRLTQRVLVVVAASAVAAGLLSAPAHADTPDEPQAPSAPLSRPQPPTPPPVAHPRPTAPIARYYLSGRFGERGGHWRLGHHTGLDFVAPYGTPVHAVASGRVVKLAWNSSYGRMVILEVAPGVTVWYCHLSRVLVKVGAVTQGQVLGRVGLSGNTTGAHLHVEVRVRDRPTDPAAYLWGKHPGTPGAVPRWYPAVPISTVAKLSWLGSR
jgi:murein DD-endopeptidase MepM/ murein hydrolase activator NlpD